jgi:rare lipoprotein A
MITCYTTNAHSKETQEHHSVIKTINLVTSWYNYGKKTANGERFNPHAMTAAHKSLPFGTKLRLTNPENNRTIIVTINDRGPYKRGRGLDITVGCAHKLGMYNEGVKRLRVEVLR